MRQSSNSEFNPLHLLRTVGLTSIGNGACVFLSQPVEVLKVTLQTSPNLTGTQAFHYATKDGWFPHLWRGAIAGATSKIIKNAYHTPLMLYTPPFIAQVLNRYNDNGTPDITANTLAGGAVGTVNATITAITDRTKIRQIVTNTGLAKTLKTFSPASLMYGYPITVLKESLSWANFFVTYHAMQEIHRSYYGDKALSVYEILLGTLASTTTNILATNALDVIKTRQQSTDPALKTSPGIWQTAKNIYQIHGIRGFAAGWFPRSIHGFAATAIGFLGAQYYHSLYTSQPETKKNTLGSECFSDRIQAERTAVNAAGKRL